MINKEKNIVVLDDMGINFEIERPCIKNCTETHDGISIQLLNGTMILHENVEMPNSTKKSIVNAVNTFNKVKKTIINFRDYNKPVRIIT